VAGRLACLDEKGSVVGRMPESSDLQRPALHPPLLVKTRRYRCSERLCLIEGPADRWWGLTTVNVQKALRLSKRTGQERVEVANPK
jgi:hypothetical protein